MPDYWDFKETSKFRNFYDPVNGWALEDGPASTVVGAGTGGMSLDQKKSLTPSVMFDTEKTIRYILTLTGRNLTYAVYETDTQDDITGGTQVASGSIGDGINDTIITITVKGAWGKLTPDKYLTAHYVSNGASPNTWSGMNATCFIPESADT